MIRKTFAFFAVAALCGCSSFSSIAKLTPPFTEQGTRSLVLEPRFVRATPATEFFGYRRLNRMTPLLTEKLVVQGNAIDGIVAYDRQSGREVWRQKIENGVEGGVEAANENLYFGGGDGLLRSAKLSTGAINWTVAMRAELLAPPTVDGSLVYAQTGADVIYGLDAASGKLAWTYNRQVTGNLSVRATSKPIIVGDSLLAGFSDGFVVALRKRDGSMIWERKLGKGNRFRDVDSTPVIDGDKMYVASFDGQLAAVKIASGDIVWQSDLGGYLPVTMGAGQFADRLYFATVDGRVVELDRATGKETRMIKLQKGIATQPVINKNVLVYGESEGAVRVVDLESFKTLALYHSGDGLLATPAFDRSKNEIWFVSSAANLYALRMSYQRMAERIPWSKIETAPISSSF